jgi:hypothetical protein
MLGDLGKVRWAPQGENIHPDEVEVSKQNVGEGDYQSPQGVEDGRCGLQEVQRAS